MIGPAPLNLDVSRALLIIALVGSTACRADRRAVTSSGAGDRFVLGIDRDGSLSLEGKKMTRQDAAREFARLADESRSGARDAVLVVWADDRAEFGTLFPLLRERKPAASVSMDLHSNLGMLTWPRSEPRVGDGAPALFVPVPTLVTAVRAVPVNVAPAPPKPKSDLPETIRTLPIELDADDRRRISGVEVEEQIFPDLRDFSDWLREIQNDPGSPFDQARLVVDPRLAFSEVVQVVDLLASCEVRTIQWDLGKAADVP